jgi:hypothetical protein
MTKIFINNDTNIIPKRIFPYLNIITCTFPRPLRIKYLSHLKDLLSNEQNIRWIIVDDNDQKDNELVKFLPNFATYLYIGPTRNKGHAQRNLALEYIYDNKFDGLIYNADDDNMYDHRMFQELRKTKIFSFLPVGGDLSGIDGTPERPILGRRGKFIGWNSYWQRKYAIDMGGFCFDSSLLHKLRKPFWSYEDGRGGENEFIDKLISSPHEAEFLCDGCTVTYCFHNELLRKIEK